MAWTCHDRPSQSTGSWVSSILVESRLAPWSSRPTLRCANACLRCSRMACMCYTTTTASTSMRRLARMAYMTATFYSSTGRSVAAGLVSRPRPTRPIGRLDAGVTPPPGLPSPPSAAPLPPAPPPQIAPPPPRPTMSLTWMWTLRSSWRRQFRRSRKQRRRRTVSRLLAGRRRRECSHRRRRSRRRRSHVRSWLITSGSTWWCPTRSSCHRSAAPRCRTRQPAPPAPSRSTSSQSRIQSSLATMARSWSPPHGWAPARRRKRGGTKWI